MMLTRKMNIYVLSSLLVSVEVIEFHTSEVYCDRNLSVRYRTRRLSREENEKSYNPN
jgi:hypothetical protein